MQEIGFGAYLTKPVQGSEIFDCLSTVLSGQVAGKPAQSNPQDVGSGTVAPGWRGSHGPNPQDVGKGLIREMRRGTVRILLAEDNITNQQVALGILKKLGLRAEAVANGAEAVKALELIPYDLVLMDVQMPEMDGLEATQEIRNPRSAVRNHQIPIIAMTAHAMQGDRERCIAAGMNDYVSKPVFPQALMEVLEKWLPKEKETEYPISNKEFPMVKENDETAPDPVQERGDGQDNQRANTNPPLDVGHSLLDIGYSQLPVFDKADMMARLMDDEDLARRVAGGFLEDIPKQIEVLKGCLEAGDVATAERQAHSIKGASANVGGQALREVAFAMEKAGKTGDLEGVTARLPELETQFARLKTSMSEFLNHT
jgi:CheY-like chemotaxis protein/HPt (histidine-containing phosphotransfer) domain-containing protein